MEKSEIKEKVINQEDFIHAPKFGNSLNKFLAKTDKILENGAIGKLLQITAEEVESIYQESVDLLREGMAKDDEELD
ncbi:MAG TPA: hypothetical protein VIJ14_01305 [Rhabdochlamydiaceae bacterium]